VSSFDRNIADKRNGRHGVGTHGWMLHCRVIRGQRGHVGDSRRSSAGVRLKHSTVRLHSTSWATKKEAHQITGRDWRKGQEAVQMHTLRSHRTQPSHLPNGFCVEDPCPGGHTLCGRETTYLFQMMTDLAVRSKWDTKLRVGRTEGISRGWVTGLAVGI
jgi:hypothetical protein